MHDHQAVNADVASAIVPEIIIERQRDDENDNLIEDNRENAISLTENRNSVTSDLCDTDYNASVESNDSSRRSSIDMPQYQLTFESGGGGRNEDDVDNNEVGTLELYNCLVLLSNSILVNEW